jgi:SAM-dependent methyltransferase
MMVENAQFVAYGRYYDALYEDKDYVGEANYIDLLLKRHKIQGMSVLEFGSGTGRHGNLLADLGYRVHGIERSHEMVARAIEGNGFTTEQGDICRVNLGRKFDAVISLFHVVSYQISNEAVLAVFQKAREHVHNQGLFLFDVWYSPAVHEQKPTVRVKRISTIDTDITRIAEPALIPNENRVDVKYTIYAQDIQTKSIQTFSELHPMRHFSIPEIRILADMNEFELVEAKEFLTAAEPSEKTWGVCFVLRKIQA